MFCSNSDYLLHSESYCKKSTKRCFREKELKKTSKQLAKMDRNELLRDRIKNNKEPQTIRVSTWYCKLSAIPSILKNKFHLISSDPKLSKIFKLLSPTKKTHLFQITFWKAILQINNFIPTYQLVENANISPK